MGSIDWSQVRKIFEAALELDAAKRNAYVAEACADDVELRVEVETLLKSHSIVEEKDFIEQTAMERVLDLDDFEMLPDLVGQRIGVYQVISQIGVGGMGAIYLAKRADGVFQKQVAIKTLQPSTNPQEISRFLRERQILAELDHPNIARILDGGAIHGLPYVVMEYVPGESLRATLRSRGALPLNQIVEITKQICAGLSEAHRKGIVHRDIKPENIIINEDDDALRVKVLDFGIAKLNGVNTDTNKTTTGSMIGTPRYMSPEQLGALSNEQIDLRTDIYSLGMVVYEMLTGQVAFNDSSWMEIGHKQIYEVPQPPSLVRPDLPIPPAIERVVLKALEKDRETRHQSARSFADELEAGWRSTLQKTTEISPPVISTVIYQIEPQRRTREIASGQSTIDISSSNKTESGLSGNTIAVSKTKLSKPRLIAPLVVSSALVVGGGIAFFKFSATPKPQSISELSIIHPSIQTQPSLKPEPSPKPDRTITPSVTPTKQLQKTVTPSPTATGSPSATPSAKSEPSSPFVFSESIKTDMKRAYQLTLPQNSGQVGIKVVLGKNESYAGQTELISDSGQKFLCSDSLQNGGKELFLQTDAKKMLSGGYTLKVKLIKKKFLGGNKESFFESRIYLTKQ